MRVIHSIVQDCLGFCSKHKLKLALGAGHVGIWDVVNKNVRRWFTNRKASWSVRLLSIIFRFHPNWLLSEQVFAKGKLNVKLWNNCRARPPNSRQKDIAAPEIFISMTFCRLLQRAGHCNLKTWSRITLATMAYIQVHIKLVFISSQHNKYAMGWTLQFKKNNAGYGLARFMFTSFQANITKMGESFHSYVIFYSMEKFRIFCFLYCFLVKNLKRTTFISETP